VLRAHIVASLLVGCLVVLLGTGARLSADGAKDKAELEAAWRAAKEPKEQQAAGKRVLKELPDDALAFEVLLRFVEQGWTVPRLATSYEVLQGWTFDRVDGKKQPDVRLALIDLLERDHPTSYLVKEGGILYCRSWAHWAAKRYEQAIKIGEQFVARFPKSSNVDDARWTIAESMLALAPPDLAGAKRHLKAILALEKSDRKTSAEQLLAAVEGGGADAQPTEGFPRAGGLGKVVVLTNLAAGDPLWKALARWREARKAETVRFEGNEVARAADGLRKHGAEFVAVAVAPATVDINFHLELLETCRNLDADPMPDFSFGYLTARSPEDLAAFTERILAKEAVGGTRAGLVAPSATGKELESLDFALHFGHGNPSGIVGGVGAEQVAALSLPSTPVVFSGACFHGVLSRSYHPCAYQPVFLAPETVPVERLLSLAWVHAGATGLLAAQEGDRGEMAMAEWEHFREGAEPLGAVVGHSYRLAFTSLPATFGGFPRYKPGVAKRMGFYDVMLRGLVSRLLVGDPSFRPLHEPLETPSVTAAAEPAADGKSVTATLHVRRFKNGPFLNVLPERVDGVFDTRLTARVALPEGFTGRLEDPKVAVEHAGGAVPFGRTQVRHEVWGGRRWLNLQVEGADGRLATAGTKATFTFAVR
jgi:hypothetical protein